MSIAIDRNVYKQGMTTRTAKRVRRSPEAAKTHILDIAEQRLATHGPEGLKIADVAKEAGITHSTVLHHFGSAAELQKALVERMTASLLGDILKTLDSDEIESGDVAQIVSRVFSTLSDRGHARLMAWLTLTGQRDHSMSEGDHLLADVVSLIERRLNNQEGTTSRDAHKAAQYVVMLAAFAAIGDGVSREFLSPIIGLDEEDAQEGFRRWFADMLSDWSLDDGADQQKA